MTLVYIDHKAAVFSTSMKRESFGYWEKQDEDFHHISIKIMLKLINNNKILL
jgi:hypothetical protein